MDIDALRKFCLQFPYTTENVQWGYDLCFKLDGKLFAVTPLEPAPVRLSFKCSPENFAELCERSGVRPAPYMARAQWVALEQLNTLPDSELRDLLTESYELVWERLPKKRQAELQRRTSADPNAKKLAAKKSVAKKRAARKSAPTKRGGRKSADGPKISKSVRESATKTKSSKAGRGR